MRAVLAFVLACVLAAPALAQNQPQQPPPPSGQAQTERRTFTWDSETLGLFASLGVQEGGRVKPLDTLAGFKLLKIAGRRRCDTPDGSIGPVPWLLDCLFFPEQATTYPCFRVQNAEALDRIGLAHENKRKRDWYSYDELAPGIPQLFDLAQKLSQKNEKDRDAAESEVVQLAHNVFEFEALIHFLDFTRVELPFRSSGGLARIYPEGSKGVAAAIARARLVLGLFQELETAQNLDPARKKQEQDALQAFYQATVRATEHSRALAIFPPSVPVAAETEWMTPFDLVQKCFTPNAAFEKQTELLGVLEQLAQSRGNLDAFKAKLRALHEGLRGLADARGEYSKIPLEVAFYKGDFFYKALLVFVLAFVLSAISWTKPQSKPLFRGSLGATGLGAFLVVLGIVLRCIIRSRPPVSTLYETILFITGVAVISCLVIEWLNRQRIAASVASFLGMMGMFLATKYEFKESVTAGDTMPSLVAVLDTNFWLATHVTSVTMGYSAGLLAAAIAHVWLFGQILGVRREDTRFYKNIVRMIYGVLCFGLLFSTVGTILGGIWANYSWGRFWGWDPKENGALMICLWELIIFHARLGGYIRDYGLCIMTILGGCVIGFSWWGVNLLGVGLHSYGFTSGIYQILVGAYVLEAVIVVISAGWWLAGAGKTPPAPPLPSAPPQA